MGIIAVVPASSENRYSPKGDLVEWGYTTLLQWKISQLKSVRGLDRIVVSTSSPEVASCAKDSGAEVLVRETGIPLPDLFRTVAGAMPADAHLLWVNPTSPFAGGKLYSALIADYLEADCPEEGEVTSRRIKEYMYLEGKPLGFESNRPAFSRVELPEMQVVTNGAYIAPAPSIAKRGRAFGDSPRFFQVDWLSALEIRDAEQMGIFATLIEKYFESEE